VLSAIPAHVDDPYVYGQIAAANALSDVYAMGRRPLTALAIAGFPKDGLDLDYIRAIFRGGFDKLREAGVALLGGHTVQDPEIKFGYAVTGAIDPARIATNAGARPGDVLFLTKPLGTGIVGSAIKFERATPQMIEEAVQSMRTLNRAAAEALAQLPAGAVHACTDVTGFGLAGHASEMAAASGVLLEIAIRQVPLLQGGERFARTPELQPGGLKTNISHFSQRIHEAPYEVDEFMLPASVLVYDPQTSGGLLVAAAHGAADDVERALKARGVVAARIGEAREPDPRWLLRLVR